MTADIFGNLRDWGPVMEQLGGLRERGELDQHRAGLTRILRYRENWRLRETVLKYMRDLTDPSDELLQSALVIMMDENVYHDARILAAEALAHLLRGRSARDATSGAVTAQLVLERMNTLMNTPQTPFFHKAIDDIRQSLNE